MSTKPRLLPEVTKLTEEIRVYAPPELRILLGEKADEAGVPLSEYVVQICAKQLGRQDLAHVPRKSLGRPRKKQLVGA